MCLFQSKIKKIKGKLVMDIFCGISGKPITYSDKYGMFCEDKCGYEEVKKEYQTYQRFVNILAQMKEASKKSRNKRKIQ